MCTEFLMAISESIRMVSGMKSNPGRGPVTPTNIALNCLLGSQNSFYYKCH